MPVHWLSTGHEQTDRLVRPIVDLLNAQEKTIAALATLVATALPNLHATTHQDGGTDEINVTGLTGLLATAQTPAAHVHVEADVTSLVADLAARFTGVTVQVLTANGTYTPTANMKHCLMFATGGGGGGGGADTNAANGTVGVGGGGGAGGTGIRVFSAATIGASQSVTIGAAGGPGAASGGGNGGAGGTTSVGALTITGVGGNGGTGSGASTLTTSAAPGGSGGSSTGTVLVSGGDGHAGAGGSVDGTTDLIFGMGGIGGGSFWGGGGKGVSAVANNLASTTIVVGNTGIARGSGGSGAVCLAGGGSTGIDGGDGRAGILVVIEFT